MHARALLPVLVLGAPSVTIVSDASAQGSAGAKELFLGAAFNGSVLDTDDPSYDSEAGTGVFVQAAFGFTPRLALVIEGGGSAMHSNGASGWPRTQTSACATILLERASTLGAGCSTSSEHGLRCLDS